ncbi:hypothetical protein ACFLT1_07545 [Bacteroidota bacterium]
MRRCNTIANKEQFVTPSPLGEGRVGGNEVLGSATVRRCDSATVRRCNTIANKEQFVTPSPLGEGRVGGNEVLGSATVRRWDGGTVQHPTRD